jgi:hypothetical protein
MTRRPSIDSLWYAPVMDPTSAACIALEHRSAELEVIWRANMARRDAAAIRHGEPQTSHEFYRGTHIKRTA